MDCRRFGASFPRIRGRLARCDSPPSSSCWRWRPASRRRRRSIPPPSRSRGRSSTTCARGADLDAEPHLAHELKNPTSEAQIAEFRSIIPADAPRLIELKAWDAHEDSTGITTRLTEDYHYGDKVLIVQTALFKSPSGVDPVIVGFQVKESDGTD